MSDEIFKQLENRELARTKIAESDTGVLEKLAAVGIIISKSIDDYLLQKIVSDSTLEEVFRDIHNAIDAQNN